MPVPSPSLVSGVYMITGIENQFAGLTATESVILPEAIDRLAKNSTKATATLFNFRQPSSADERRIMQHAFEIWSGRLLCFYSSSMSSAPTGTGSVSSCIGCTFPPHSVRRRLSRL